MSNEAKDLTDKEKTVLLAIAATDYVCENDILDKMMFATWAWQVVDIAAKSGLGGKAVGGVLQSLARRDLIVVSGSPAPLLSGRVSDDISVTMTEAGAAVLRDVYVDDLKTQVHRLAAELAAERSRVEDLGRKFERFAAELSAELGMNEETD